jgi:hypothetical protein
LKLQQENEDRKNELVISNLEERVKELENLLAEKDLKIKTAEADLAKRIFRLRIKLLVILIKTNSLKKHIQN